MTAEERAKAIVYALLDTEADHDMAAAIVGHIRAAILAERETCATIADSYDGIYHNTARHIAAAIRARGEKEQ